MNLREEFEKYHRTKFSYIPGVLDKCYGTYLTESTYTAWREFQCRHKLAAKPIQGGDL